MWPETTPAVAAELTSGVSELDRLNGAIAEILDLSRGQRLGDAADVDLWELLADTVGRWTPHFAAAGRELHHDPTEPVLAHVVPGPVVQVLDVLFDNACAHGRGRVVVGARSRGPYLHVVVRDQGEEDRRGRGVPARHERSGQRGARARPRPSASQLATSLGG